MNRTLLATGVMLAAMSLPALAAPPKFTGTCPMGITVKSNGSGTVKINGKRASVKTINSNAWDASGNGVTINIARDAGGLMLAYTGKGGANGVCQVTSASTGGAAASAPAAGTPSQDEQACLAATSRETNNGDVMLLSTETSEANNTVYIGVGPQRAKWKCLVKNGKVADVESMGN